MAKYIAKKDGFGIFLSKPEQIEKYLKSGCDIYKIEDEKEILFASPDSGLPRKIPDFGAVETFSLKENL
ncbi:hypothetical protein [Blautia stercoris]